MQLTRPEWTVLVFEAAQRPSQSAADDLSSRDAERQRSKWCHKVGADQVDDILRIVDGFDLDFYTDALHPDCDRLMQFQRDEARAATPSHAA